MKETLPEDILAKMHAAPKPDVPIIDPHDLPNADGFLFGFPTRRAPDLLLAIWNCDLALRNPCDMAQGK